MSLTSDDAQKSSPKPLRTFSDQTPKRRSPYLPEIELCGYFLAPLLILAVITGLGIYAANIYESKIPVSTNSSDQGSNFLAEDGSVAQGRFLKAYLEAKGLKPDHPAKPTFHFRGNYATGDGLAAFTGESDAMGNGSVELAEQTRDDLIRFRHGDLQSEPAKVFVGENLAVHSLATCFKDPLYALALSPNDYVAQMHREKELGLDVIIVDLLHKPSAEKMTISVDANDLKIKQIVSSAAFGQLTLKFQRYYESNGVRLPQKIFASDGSGMSLPIDFSEISIAHSRTRHAIVGKVEYE